jgi:hypothetical protein
MTVQRYDFETMRMAFALTLGGHSPREVRELVLAREAERDRLLSERDRLRRDYDN